jgi:hypothetical protein
MAIKSFVLLLSSILISGLLGAQEQYFRVLIPFQDGLSLALLHESGTDAEHIVKSPKGYILEVSDSELSFFVNQNLEIDTLVSDLSQWYRDQNDQSSHEASVYLWNRCNAKLLPEAPAGFETGSMGGYLTYEEMLEQMDNLHQTYPLIFSAPFAINDTLLTEEGRPVYAMYVGDNPSMDEGEPELLITSLHHSREPMSLMQLMFFLWYLGEQYGTNEEVTAILNNVRLCVVPCVNPDGYVYNQETNPNGGGLWRKNRRRINGVPVGVDLNRNYGSNWAYDNTGSSPNPQSQTYRGTSAFSEPETQLMKQLCEEHNFLIALNYHSFSNVLIYPFSYDANAVNPELETFINLGHEMTLDNCYFTGTTPETINYSTNGDSDDWMFDVQSILALTPEVGSPDYGFWPPADAIIPMCSQMLSSNLNAMRMCINYVSLSNRGPEFIHANNAVMKASVKQGGLNPETTKIWATSLTPGFTIAQDTIQVQLENVGQTQEIELSASIISSELVYRQEIKAVWHIDQGAYIQHDTITMYFGQPDTLLFDIASNFNKWNAAFPWETTGAQFTSPSTSFTDSPGGNYDSFTFAELVTNDNFSLTTGDRARLSIMLNWLIEPVYDRFTVSVLPQGGGEWVNLCGDLGVLRNVDNQTNQPVFEGRSAGWRKTTFNLDEFAGQSIRLRIEFQSDDFVEFDGVYVDDILIERLPLEPVTTREITETLLPRVFPVPCKEQFTMQFPEEALFHSSTLEMYDVLGRIEHQEAIHSHLQTFAAPQSKGVYFLRIRDKNGFRHAGRIVVD